MSVTVREVKKAVSVRLSVNGVPWASRMSTSGIRDSLSRQRTAVFSLGFEAATFAR